ncbi:unnamed protein product, partial [Dibothriocephalus latus]
MFEVLSQTADDEWPELGQSAAQEVTKAKVPVKSKSKRKWKRLDEEDLAKMEESENTGPVQETGVQTGSPPKEPAVIEPVANDASRSRKLNGVGEPQSRKITTEFNDCGGAPCLFVRPDYAGFEIPVTIPRPGFNPNIVSHYRNFGRCVQTCGCRSPGCLICEGERLARIKYQVEYYFGDRNFGRDSYLQSQITDDRYVPVKVVLDFPRMRQLGTTLEDLVKVRTYFLCNVQDNCQPVPPPDTENVSSTPPEDTWQTVERRVKRTRNRSSCEGPEEAPKPSTSQRSQAQSRSRLHSTCSEQSDADEDELLNYLVVIVPERASGREQKHTTMHASAEDLESDVRKGTAALSIPESRSKSTSASLQASPCPPQKLAQSSSDYLSTSGVSSRLLMKHPGGDRHPNPDYQSRAKTQADLAREIKHGLEVYQKSIRRQRCRSYQQLGFEFDFESDGYISSRTDSFTDLSGGEDRFSEQKANKVQLVSPEEFASLKRAAEEEEKEDYKQTAAFKHESTQATTPPS